MTERARTRAPLRPSLRARLLIGILVPVLAVIVVNAVSLYRQAHAAASTAYDRTLLASAKSIAEMLEVESRNGVATLKATLPYAALEPFEADNRTQMFYRVLGFAGETVSGFDDLPRWDGTLPMKGLYAALVDFYDASYRGMPVRVAVLLQPVAGPEGLGMATIQVAETLALRDTLARQILLDTSWREGLLVAVIVLVVVFVVQRATAPVRELSALIDARSESELAPIACADAPRELMPLIDATNRALQRVSNLMQHQQRFVRDTAHQLRTPFAVLKAQVQSALRGDVEPGQALREISTTVERGTGLANQMLALAKVEQLRQEGNPQVIDWDRATREVALDVAALIADKHLDFSITTVPAWVRGHEWSLRELVRNLLHNAIKHSPEGRRLAVALIRDGDRAQLTISDEGPGISPAQRKSLFQPFAAGALSEGSGLGLAICLQIVDSLGGEIALENRMRDGHVSGLDARVRLALAPGA